MPLSQKHRSTIYQKLEPILGEEEAEALLSQFPARELDEPVTKEFVRAELADFRTEFGAEIAEVRVELHHLANRPLFSLRAVTIPTLVLFITVARFALRLA